MLYYGDKISPNMVKTPEGYLICKNVPLGRVGTMDYLGAEIPREFGVDANKIVKVKRSPEQLFSPETIASFEGKPVTNLHPSDNLTVDSAPYTSRGHVQNVRQEGKYLIGDLYITDPGLVDEVVNNRKREVSCGYDAGWKDNGDGTYEQVGILGNHVAVVPTGRAGHGVAIKDSAPEVEIKKNGGKKMKSNNETIWGKMFKAFAIDAEPEEVAAASKMMPKEEKEAKDAEPAPSMVEATTPPVIDEDPLAEVNAKIDKLMEIVGSLVESDKKVHENVAKESMDELEEELGKPEEEETLEDEEEETPEVQAKEKEEGKEQHVFVSDEEAVKKIVKDMKPIIMGIKDEKLRNEVAQKFVKSVRDSRTVTKNDYGSIMKSVANNQRKAAKDSAVQQESYAERGMKAADAWKQAAQNLKGGK